MTSPVFLYASVGESLTRYELDIDSASLIQRESISLPDTVQYVWPHPTKRVFYVASSIRCPVGGSGVGHHLTALAADERGVLRQLGAPEALPNRPIHLTVDHDGRYAYVTYAQPSALTVHRLNDDGTIGASIPQSAQLDFGTFAHQTRVLPSNQTVVLVARGHDEAPGEAEVPGALKLYSVQEGVLRERQTVAPGEGFGFGPRHVDFHPTKPWMFVSLERQSALQVFTISDNDDVSEHAAYSVNYLANPGGPHPHQLGGTVHVHPGGRFAYSVNRADHAEVVNGVPVVVGGENSIVVFSINALTGEPSLIQRISPQTLHVRTFSIDPTGTILVAAGIMPVWVKQGQDVVCVPAALSVFRIGSDGKLSFVRKYDVDAGPKPQWWMGIV
jgi:6-phosphogluconolactonase